MRGPPDTDLMLRRLTSILWTWVILTFHQKYVQYSSFILLPLEV